MLLEALKKFFKTLWKLLKKAAAMLWTGLKKLSNLFIDALIVTLKAIFNPVFLGAVIGTGLYIGALVTGIVPGIAALGMAMQLVVGLGSLVTGALVGFGLIKAKERYDTREERKQNRIAASIRSQSNDIMIKNLSELAKKNPNTNDIENLVKVQQQLKSHDAEVYNYGVQNYRYLVTEYNREKANRKIVLFNPAPISQESYMQPVEMGRRFSN